MSGAISGTETWLNPITSNIIQTTSKYSQTCIKRSHMVQRKSGLLNMKFSMTGQEKCDLLIQVTA